MKQGKNILVRTLLAALILLLLAGGISLYLYKGRATTIGKDTFVRLEANDNVETLTQKLRIECGLKYPFVFQFIAEKMHLSRWIKKGRYTLTPDMTLVEIAKVFREGKGKTVNLTIRGLGNIEALATLCGDKLEGDAPDFLAVLQDAHLLAQYGFDIQTAYALPLPDTYNVYWHTEPDELLLKLKQEYDIYWTTERKEKARTTGLSQIEVATLASIVGKETNKNDEMPMVAGMYLNRLKQDMPLQADPTIKFALNEPALKRIYNIHLSVVSPYNTYTNKGLPPGPICIPTKQSIEAVLNPVQHNYIYMCAKEDFSGYHNFAVTYAEHLRNAKKYRDALDQNGVK